MEETMRKHQLSLSAAAAIFSIGALLSVSAQAAPTASRTAIAADSDVVAVHHVRTSRHAHRVATHVNEGGDITSFSSSSLNVGVNHPAKK
jgi:hypothetical protein